MTGNGMVRPCSRPASVRCWPANLPPCLIGMEACVGAHHLSRKLQALGHARLMAAKYVRPYSKGEKNYPALQQESADLIDDAGALTDQSLAHPMQRLQVE